MKAAPCSGQAASPPAFARAQAPFGARYAAVLVRYRLFLAFLLLLGGFPPAAFAPAILVCLVPLILEAADRGRSPRQRFARIFVVCASVGLLKFWWLAPSLAAVVGAPMLAACLVVVAYVSVFAAVHAAAFVLASRLSGGWRLIGTFVLLSAATISLPWPLPISFAHSALDIAPMSNLAAFGGVALVDGVIIAVNVLLAGVLLAEGRARAWRLAAVLGVALSAACILFWMGSHTGNPAGAQARIAVVQTNVPSFRILMADPDRRRAEQERVLAMMEQAAASMAPLDLLVLPEYPMLFSYFGRPEDRERIDRFVAEHAISVLMTTFRVLEDGSLTSVSLLVDRAGGLQSTDKQVLFPFGEYLPGESAFPWLRRFFPFAGRLTPGAQPFALRLPGTDIHLAVLVCFDDTMTAVGRRIIGAVPPGVPMVAISLLNDQAFGHPLARDLHLDLARYRALEWGVPLLRVSNDGHSGIVAPDGRLLPESRIPAGEAALRLLVVQAQPAPGEAAARWAAVVAWGLLALAVPVLLLALMPRRGRAAC